MRGNQTIYQFAYALSTVEEYLAHILIDDSSSKDKTTDADGIDEGDEFVDKNKREKLEKSEVEADE